MFEKVVSFMFTLALIGWNIFDIVRGRASVLTWILLVVFSLGALFELGAIFEAKEKNGQNAEKKDDPSTQARPESNPSSDELSGHSAAA